MGEERINNPIPFLIFTTFIGIVLGKWWLGLAIGVGMTIIPGLSLIALTTNNLLGLLVISAFMVIGFPFFGLFKGIQRLFSGAPTEGRRIRRIKRFAFFIHFSSRPTQDGPYPPTSKRLANVPRTTKNPHVCRGSV
jgi:hypothetical protein